MTYTLIDRAQILVEALPYIQKYYNKTIVVKYGGNAMINEELFDAVMSDIVLLTLVGLKVVVVHGGGPEISEMLAKTGKESVFRDGLRYTDEETMDVVQMVLCGKVNKNLVSAINRKGGRAIGLCGVDGGLLKAQKLVRGDGKEYGLVGDIVEVDPTLVMDALEKGYIPVVSTVAQGLYDEHSYNINADTAASKLAVALKAENLMLLTDVKGVLRNPADLDTLIPEIRTTEVDALEREGVITGGMIPKIECCAEAVNGGVKRATIFDGRIPHALLIELFSDMGIGTMIR